MCARLCSGLYLRSRNLQMQIIELQHAASSVTRPLGSRHHVARDISSNSSTHIQRGSVDITCRRAFQPVGLATQEQTPVSGLQCLPPQQSANSNKQCASHPASADVLLKSGPWSRGAPAQPLNLMLSHRGCHGTLVLAGCSGHTDDLIKPT